MSECLHGLNPEWCAPCRGDERPATRSPELVSAAQRDTKQAQLDLLCDQLGLVHARVSRGSSIPANVLHAAARRFGLSADGSMPVVTERIIRAAGHSWTTAYDSRATASGGGSTVTYEGLVALNRAVALLLTQGHH